jgi:hypothetical protein
MKVRFNYKIFKMLKYLLIPIALILFNSCQEKINLNLKNSKIVRVAVEGRITDQLKEHSVRLTKTIGYLDNVKVPPLLDAKAYILEKNSGIKYDLSLSDSVNGVYHTPQFKGKIGETYSLFMDCSVGSFEASAKLDSVTKLDSIRYEYEYSKLMKFGYYKIFMSAYDPPTKNYYRFYIYLNDTLVNYKVTNASYTDDQLFNGIYMAGIEIYDIRQEWVKSKTNRVRVEMLSISKDEYDFINDMMNEINGNGSIFSGPDANIRTNFKSTTGGLDGLGLFAASSVSTLEMQLIKQHDDATNDPKYKPY